MELGTICLLPYENFTGLNHIESLSLKSESFAPTEDGAITFWPPT